MALREQGHQGPITSDQASEAASKKRKEEADLARRQTDPASPEFVKRGGDRKSEGIKVSNTDFDRKSSPKERNSKPGTLRRLARTRPDLLARIEAGNRPMAFWHFWHLPGRPFSKIMGALGGGLTPCRWPWRIRCGRNPGGCRGKNEGIKGKGRGIYGGILFLRSFITFIYQLVGRVIR